MRIAELAAGGTRSLLLAVAGAHLLLVLAFFRAPLFQDQAPYFRDLPSHYYPSFVLLERAAADGVGWPLWNRYSNAGEPFLEPYPINVIAVRLFGALWALRLDAPLHVFIAACGASALAMRRRAGPWEVWAAGAFYGFGGFVLSCSNSMQLFHGVCWAPLVVACLLACLDAPAPRRVAALGIAAAVQVSTMAGDVVVLTALAAPFLLNRRPRWRDAPPLAVAAVITVLLSAPAVLGTAWLLEGTRRGSGFSADEVLNFSASPAVLFEAVLPHFFGDVHTFSDHGYWGQPFFGEGYPYLVSLYLGPCVILLAVLGARAPGSRALLALLLLGLLMALGEHGPFASVLPVVFRSFRYPVKYFFLAHLAVCLLAARGVGQAELRRSGWLRYLPAAMLLLAAAVVAQQPQLPGRMFGWLLPALSDPRALVVASTAWPFDLFRTGVFAAAIGVSLGMARGRGPAAAAFALLDLALVNAACHPTTHKAFYDLRPELRAPIEQLSRGGGYRWFSFGVSNSPGTQFHPTLAAVNSDVWLYYADRQTLWGSTHVIDGIESAFQEEQSFAPADATLTIAERRPDRFREFAARLRLANVRWITSLVDLPVDLVTAVATVPFPVLRQPVRFYELRGALPRVFWVDHFETAAGEAYRARARTVDFDPRHTALLESPPPRLAPVSFGSPPTARWERPDPHTIRLRVSSPPGLVVVVEGHHRDWRAFTEDGQPLSIVRANGRYMAIATAGGEQALTLRFAPRWPLPALAACATGLLLCAGLFVWRYAPPARPASGPGILTGVAEPSSGWRDGRQIANTRSAGKSSPSARKSSTSPV